MSHTYHFEGGTIQVHADFRGMVRISQKDHGVSRYVEIPGKALLAFIAQFVRNERIAQLEDMGPEELLGVKLY